MAFNFALLAEFRRAELKLKQMLLTTALFRLNSQPLEPRLATTTRFFFAFTKADWALSVSIFGTMARGGSTAGATTIGLSIFGASTFASTFGASIFGASILGSTFAGFDGGISTFGGAFIESPDGIRDVSLEVGPVTAGGSTLLAVAALATIALVESAIGVVDAVVDGACCQMQNAATAPRARSPALHIPFDVT
jgi:hypothetical protein